MNSEKVKREMLEVIKTRKSPEIFLSAPLESETIRLIAETGNYAPIFGKIHITIIEDAAFIREIDTVSLEMMKHSGNEFAEKMANTPGYSAVRNAAALVVLSAPGGNDSMGFHMANVSCAAENMILAATSMNIGSRFMMGPVMSLTQEPIKTKLALPQGYEPLVVVALGNAENVSAVREKSMDNITTFVQ